MGFTVVDVNMRGTGCSGGAFDFFEPLQNLDGYDVIETIAAQPWVQDHKVGMMGISYGGISQLFTAATRPPSLAAIAPLSVLDSTQTTLYPGGILNTGFAVPWAKERVNDAAAGLGDRGPAVGIPKNSGRRSDLQGRPGTPWRGSQPLSKVKANSHYLPRVADPTGADHLRQQDRSADLHGLPVDRRADRRTLPRPGRAFHRHPAEVVHIHQRHPRRLAGPSDLQSLV